MVADHPGVAARMVSVVGSSPSRPVHSGTASQWSAASCRWLVGEPRLRPRRGWVPRGRCHGAGRNVGVWAAGNVVDPRSQVITSAGAGSAAAIAINAGILVGDDVHRAVEAIDRADRDGRPGSAPDDGQALAGLPRRSSRHSPPNRRERKPPLFRGADASAARSFAWPWQRWDSGTPRRACSIWLPQPLQVGLPHERQVVRAHIGPGSFRVRCAQRARGMVRRGGRAARSGFPRDDHGRRACASRHGGVRARPSPAHRAGPGSARSR